jgi:hypothetical protein
MASSRSRERRRDHRVAPQSIQKIPTRGHVIATRIASRVIARRESSTKVESATKPKRALRATSLRDHGFGRTVNEIVIGNRSTQAPFENLRYVRCTRRRRDRADSLKCRISSAELRIAERAGEIHRGGN